MHRSTPGSILRAAVAVALLGILFGAALAGAAEAPTYDVDPTWYDSLTPEARAHLNGFVLPPDYPEEYKERLKLYDTSKLDLPSSFNWADQGGVTTPKNQGECGACWDFAALGQLEAHLKIHYGVTLDLSEQQVLDCNTYGAGCEGGWASAAYSVAMNYGVVLEEDNPYASTDSRPCAQNSSLPFVFVDDWNYVYNDVDQIKTAVMTDGPVCSAMNADEPFPSYSGGCYNTNNGGYTNHLVLIVGWDDRACDGNGGWICKNSWGAEFGEAGFFTIQYGTALIGTSTTQVSVHVPPVSVSVTGPITLETLPADTTVTVTWVTSGGTCNTVDIWASFHHDGFRTLVASDVPNTGSYSWTVPNESTDQLVLCIVADGDTRNGFGFLPMPLKILGHKVRYVSSAGSDTPPYETPATAAHSLADCVAVCSGIDTVLVAEGDYLETVQIDGPVFISGGWSTTFAERDPAVHPTRWRSVNSALRFVAGATPKSGVAGIEFYDCQGAWYDRPATGRHGGAIQVLGGSPTIRECAFVDDAANPYGDYGTGGAILVVDGAPRIEDCTFSGCSADWGGAVCLVDATGAVFSGNTFLGNASRDSLGDGRGGAVAVEGGSVSFAGDVFSGSYGAVTGGAIAARDASLQLVDVVVEDSRALGDGGGLHASGGQVTIVRGTFRRNAAAGNGGALHVTGVGGRIANTVLTGNAAAVLGGGCLLGADAVLGLTVENCLVSGNTAAYGGGIMLYAGDGLVLQASLVTSNTGGGIAGTSGGAVVRCNDVWQNDGGDYNGLPPGEGDIQADPLCKDPAAGLYGLTVGSPCIDAGPEDPACQDPDASRCDIGPLGGPDAVTVAPSPVTGLAVADPGDGTRLLSWDAVGDPDLAAYAVFRAAADGSLTLAALVDAPATSWSDPAPHGGAYHVAAVDADGYQGSYGEPAGGTTAVGVPARTLAITAVVPNPFNPRTTIRFAVPNGGSVELAIYDLQGRRVRTLLARPLAAGSHEVVWDGRDQAGGAVASGVYLARLRVGEESRCAKLLLTR